MGGGGGGGDGEPEFQIAPMIDVLLVLLIFFMSITSAQVLSIDKEIQLPVAKDAKKKEKDVQNEANINVRWTNGKATILFENSSYDVVEPLVEKLRARHDSNAKYRAVIRGDKRLPAIEIQRVMSVIAQAGIDDISFSALNKE
ncbi:ExbD/TolR family protein [Prosthecobacter sp.]|jgi:biopolymer transport protein ExbD|uniref:ExbD/TolR family protein n=1 Tax=Prosthecobacter sp. TaxID=1965333 RepID=UPI0037C668C9